MELERVKFEIEKVTSGLKKVTFEMEKVTFETKKATIHLDMVYKTTNALSTSHWGSALETISCN